MDWIAIDVHIAGDAVTHRLADAFRLHVAEAAGLLTLAFAGMAQHAQDGSLSSVTDSQIESWALWQGKRGAFAAFFRTQLCDDGGVVRAWEKYNGANIREAQAGRARMRAYRSRKKAERSSNDTANGTTHGTANGTRDVRHNMTRHDLTRPTEHEQKPLRGADAPADKPAVVRAPRAKQEPAPWMASLAIAWTLGTLVPGSATLFRPVVAALGEAETTRRLTAYCEATEPRYASVRDFVAKHAAFAEAGEEELVKDGWLTPAGERATRP